MKQACDSVDMVVLDLRDLSTAFRQTGNEKMAKNLSMFASELETALVAIRQHESDMVMESFHRAEQSSRNLLEMGLAATEGFTHGVDNKET